MILFFLSSVISYMALAATSVQNPAVHVTGVHVVSVSAMSLAATNDQFLDNPPSSVLFQPSIPSVLDRAVSQGLVRLVKPSVGGSESAFQHKLAESVHKIRSSSAVAFTGSSDYVPSKASKLETHAEQMTRIRSNVYLRSTACVQPSTEHLYKTGWSHYVTWCKDKGYDHSLKTQPSWFIASDWPFADTVLVEFLVDIQLERDILGVTASGYLSAVRHGFRTNRWSLEPFDNPVIADTRAAHRIADSALRSFSETQRLPFTHEMLAAGIQQLWSPSIRLDVAVRVGIEISLTFLLRKSELLYCSSQAVQHFLRAQDVIFTLRSTDGAIVEVPSPDVHRFRNSEVLSVLLFVRSAKNDSGGKGKPYRLNVREVNASCAFCVVSSMFNWAVDACPLASLPFLSCNRGASLDSFVLSYQHFKAEIKRAASACGFDPTRFGSHSLRIGGATLLHAAHKDNLFIKEWGRWKSLCFLDYIEWSLGAMEVASASIADPTRFSNLDLFALHPDSRLPVC